MNIRRISLALVATGGVVMSNLAVSGDEASAAQIERGRILVEIGGCNDCHTAGYLDANGQVPESEWLKGNTVGWKGPWGTTYPPNLRLSLSTKTEEAWISFARNLRARPPMPWFVFNAMTDDDLRAIYSFITKLRPLGEPAPDYLPPGQEPTVPYFEFHVPPAE